MRQADPEEFLRAPVGKWAVAGQSLAWCASRTLCGVTCWGGPTADDARQALALYDAIFALAPEFDVLLDGSAIERVDPGALAPLLVWVTRHLDELKRRVRNRIAIVPPGVAGLTLAGISPILGGPGRYHMVTSAREAFALLPDGSPALCSEVEALVELAHGTPPLLRRLRVLLDDAQGAVELDAAARQMCVSARSLQRGLAASGSSYRREQQDARFRAVEVLLVSDDKLAIVAGALGLTEGGLAALVRARTGLTPGEYRRKLKTT